MAQRKTNTTKRSDQKSGSTSKKAPASSRSAKNSRQSTVYEDKEPLYSVIWSYSWGKALYLLLGILVLIGLDFLIAMNHYDLFFTVLGIEIIAAMLIGWIVFIILDRFKHKELSEMSDEGSEE